MRRRTGRFSKLKSCFEAIRGSAIGLARVACDRPYRFVAASVERAQRNPVAPRYFRSVVSGYGMRRVTVARLSALLNAPPRMTRVPDVFDSGIGRPPTYGFIG